MNFEVRLAFLRPRRESRRELALVVRDTLIVRHEILLLHRITYRGMNKRVAHVNITPCRIVYVTIGDLKIDEHRPSLYL